MPAEHHARDPGEALRPPEVHHQAPAQVEIGASARCVPVMWVGILATIVLPPVGAQHLERKVLAQASLSRWGGDSWRVLESFHAVPPWWTFRRGLPVLPYARDIRYAPMAKVELAFDVIPFVLARSSPLFR